MDYGRWSRNKSRARTRTITRKRALRLETLIGGNWIGGRARDGGGAEVKQKTQRGGGGRGCGGRGERRVINAQRGYALAFTPSRFNNTRDEPKEEERECVCAREEQRPKARIIAPSQTRLRRIKSESMLASSNSAAEAESEAEAEAEVEALVWLSDG